MIAEYGKRVAQNHKIIHIFAYQLRKQSWKWKLISKCGISLGENEWMVASQEKDKGRCGSRFHNLTILDPQLLKLLFSYLENDKRNVCWISQQARAWNFSSTSKKKIIIYIYEFLIPNSKVSSILIARKLLLLLW